MNDVYVRINGDMVMVKECNKRGSTVLVWCWKAAGDAADEQPVQTGSPRSRRWTRFGKQLPKAPRRSDDD